MYLVRRTKKGRVVYQTDNKDDALAWGAKNIEGTFFVQVRVARSLTGRPNWRARKEMQEAAGKPLPPPPDELSKSVRTVSGGLPTLGKKRR